MNILQYLKQSWINDYLADAVKLLPQDVKIALRIDKKQIFLHGENAGDIGQYGAENIQLFNLTLEDRNAGLLVILTPTKTAAQASAWGNSVMSSMQRVLDVEHARSFEALESHREFAALQRVVSKLNSSLDPSIIVDSLLFEFKDNDFGAVFLRNLDGDLELTHSFGVDEEAFVSLFESDLFLQITQKNVCNIINDLPNDIVSIGFRSLLCMQLSIQDDDLGILILGSGNFNSFTAHDLKRAQTLSSVAAIALRNANLYTAQQRMLPSFVSVIATAIDAKSPHTAGHCMRVPEIVMMLAEAADEAQDGPLCDFVLDATTKNTLEIASILHDCGKIITPERVMEKATKLDAAINRMELVSLRFELLHKEAELNFFKTSDKAKYEQLIQKYNEDLEFLQKCNLGDEFMSEENAEKIKMLADIRWHNSKGEALPLLTENETYNLLIERGTLNAEERKIIEDHALHTINMLSRIEFPPELKNVVEYASGHHERMDGKGYPKGLTREQLSIPARIIGIADIFEALTATDRPYRKHGTLSRAIDIMHKMKQDNHIDGDLFDLLLYSGVYDRYAKKHLLPEQFDAVNIENYLK